MNEANIENHMVLNTPDAPWNAPDATGTCDQCHETKDTDGVSVKGITRELCEECADEALTPIFHARWAAELRTACVGDVVVCEHKGYSTAMSVTAVEDDQIWGHRIQFGENGEVYSFSTSGHSKFTELSKDLLNLTVVPA